ncbi:MAG: heme exporter protein CcmB [Candidatus Limnocylindria bacterium]
MSLRRAALVAGRELRAERAQPDGLVAAATFTAVLVFLESLAVGPARAREPQIAASLFWIAIAFAAILAATRSFDRELEDDAIDAILALPGGRDALYAGKVLALTAALAVVAAVGGALSLVLLSLDVALPAHLLASAVCAVVALPPVVVLDVALALRLRSRALLVPILALPLLLPQLVAATQGSAAAIAGDATAALAWSALLVAFALVYGALGLTIVPAAIE